MEEKVEKILKKHFREVCVGHLKHSCKDLQHLAPGKILLLTIKAFLWWFLCSSLEDGIVDLKITASGY